MGVRNLVLVFLVLFSHSGFALDRYYMSVFGIQTDDNPPPKSHSFAVFMRVSKKGDFEMHTISWMPKSRIVKVLDQPQAGENLTLRMSLKLALDIESNVTQWGPYEIHRQLYEMALAQEKHLAEGRIKYVVMDYYLRPKLATSCIHALSDIDTTRSLLRTYKARGNAASRMVIRHLGRWIKNDRLPSPLDRWLEQRLEIRKGEFRRLKFSRELAAIPR